MPFDELETFTKESALPEATVTYDFAQKKGSVPRADKKPRLTISVPTTLCGTSKSKTWRLLLGSGADKGKLLIRGDIREPNRKAAAPVGVTPSQHAHFFRWNFGFVPKLGEDRFAGEKRPVRKVSDEEFEITVPESWFGDPA